MSDVIAEPFPRSNRHLIKKIRLIEGDLTKQTGVDALVSAIPVNLDIGGSMNRALVDAAGEQIDRFILEHIYKPNAGDVFAVPGFALPVPHLIFAVTPHWRDGLDREDRDLIRCYRGVVQMALRMGLKRIAMPALGTGARKFPVRRAARLGVQGIMDRITDDIDEIRIVCDRAETYDAFYKWLVHYGWAK